ncbi:hypothetical protein IMZ29_07230 [Achromobacter sp. GG226]|uniref:hypothetical protein n=1 Tax=Verticiella alkaliphila TaxID=2779529 RepID=UPI001C0C341A|nr:hypothetical protein [Verticiella sp. GG226]MBU4610340.1 hypothetical protein [Verticiella sp. GG226]
MQSYVSFAAVLETVRAVPGASPVAITTWLRHSMAAYCRRLLSATPDELAQAEEGLQGRAAELVRWLCATKGNPLDLVAEVEQLGVRRPAMGRLMARAIAVYASHIASMPAARVRAVSSRVDASTWRAIAVGIDSSIGLVAAFESRGEGATWRRSGNRNGTG